MRHDDLVRQIKRAAAAKGLTFELLRTGDHEVWSLRGERVVIPGHRELNEKLARSIRSDLEFLLGKGWWEK